MIDASLRRLRSQIVDSPRWLLLCSLPATSLPLTITAAGVGASAGVTHTMGGITYRTFTAPLPKVKNATMTALNRMGINGITWAFTFNASDQIARIAMSRN